VLGNFENFKSEGFSVEEGEKEIETEIKENSVIVRTKIPLTISKEDSIETFSDFNAEIKPVRMIKILSLVNSIVDEQKKDDSSICTTCLLEKEKQSGIEIEFLETDDRNELFTSLQILIQFLPEAIFLLILPQNIIFQIAVNSGGVSNEKGTLFFID